MARVLVIDDDEIARELLVSILRDGAHDVFDLPSPIGATQLIASRGIDVVVLDLMMPALSGDKLAKMLRSNPRLRGLGIVLVSSCDIRELEELAARVNANAVVSKRHVRENLLSAVASAHTPSLAEFKPDTAS
jgi:CheY-like chemotaxis protein